MLKNILNILPDNLLKEIYFKIIIKEKSNINLDIINYHKTKKKLFNKYKNIFYCDFESCIIYDLLSDHIHMSISYDKLIYFYTVEFYLIWKRNFLVKDYDYSEINFYVNKRFKYLSSNYQINIFWGLLLPQERQEFLNSF